MTTGHPPVDIPPAWDQLAERTTEVEADRDDGPIEDGPAAHRGNLILAALADLVALLTFCAATVAALRGAGFQPGLGVIPWAGALAVGWWLTAAATLVAVRRGTPGLLISGLAFSHPVAPERVASTLATALLCACLFGVPVVFGRGRSVVELAAGSPVVGAPAEGARTD